MCRILIVEDELIERMVLKKTLMKRFRDCEVVEAENGREAINIFHDKEIDITIMDIEMPGIKGIEVAELMRKENKDICIIFLSAYDKFEYARKAISVRAMEYLLKPYSEREIVSVIEEAVRSCIVSETENSMDGEPDDGYMELKYLQGGIQGANTVNSLAGSECGTGVAEVEEQKLLQTQSLTDDNINRLRVMVSMVEEYIRSNYMYDISMQDAAQAVNYSEPYFCKMFKLQYGQSFTSYLTDYRIEKAKKMLMQPTINVKVVGERVGYGDSNYFARVFRRVTGVSPSEYRNSFLKSL